MSVKSQKVHLLGDERVVVDAVEEAAVVTAAEVDATVEPTVTLWATARLAKPVRPQACQKRILTELNRPSSSSQASVQVGNIMFLRRLWLAGKDVLLLYIPAHTEFTLSSFLSLLSTY